MKRARWIPIVSALLLASPALAGGMKIEPGKWEFEHTMTTPMSPQPRTSTSTECITDAEISPEAFMDAAQECKVTETAATSTSLRWKVVCTTPGGESRGGAEFSSTGSEVRGSMTMSMKFGEREMTFENKWVGRRVGSCE